VSAGSPQTRRRDSAFPGPLVAAFALLPGDQQSRERDVSEPRFRLLRPRRAYAPRSFRRVQTTERATFALDGPNRATASPLSGPRNQGARTTPLARDCVKPSDRFRPVCRRPSCTAGRPRPVSRTCRALTSPVTAATSFFDRRRVSSGHTCGGIARGRRLVLIVHPGRRVHQRCRPRAGWGKPARASLRGAGRSRRLTSG
jgi:hypothetical protein